MISARKGEFETGFERGGQTREHAMLAKTAGVRYLVVLINKMDDSTVEWDEGRYAFFVQSYEPNKSRKCCWTHRLWRLLDPPTSEIVGPTDFEGCWTHQLRRLVLHIHSRSSVRSFDRFSGDIVLLIFGAVDLTEPTAAGIIGQLFFCLLFPSPWVLYWQEGAH